MIQVPGKHVKRSFIIASHNGMQEPTVTKISFICGEKNMMHEQLCEEFFFFLIFYNVKSKGHPKMFHML